MTCGAPKSASAWVRGVGPRSRPGEMGREKGSAGPTVFCPFFFSFFLFSFFFSSIFLLKFKFPDSNKFKFLL